MNIIKNIAIASLVFSSVSWIKIAPKESGNSISTQEWKNLKGLSGMDCFSPKEQKIYTAGQKSIRDSLRIGAKVIKK
ncbi:MAG: hypothetical protein WCG95_07245 [bacterium]